MLNQTLLKRSSFITLLLFLLISLPTVFASGHANFSGVWVLDKAKSSNLPTVFQTVDEYSLIIKQTEDKSITITTEFVGRGQKISSGSDNYPIDGTAVEKQDQRGFNMKRSFRFADDQKLVVETTKKFTGDVQLPNTDEVESWEISADSKTLTVTITSRTDTNQKQVRVFTKKTQEVN